jgi:single-strand DNA-binding protein
MDINNVIMNGRLGKKPEIRKIGKGKTANIVATFSIASNETYTNRNGEKVENVDWFTVEVWGKLAEVVEKYLDKGRAVSVQGRLKTSSWEDENGEKKTRAFIKANTIQMLGGKPQDSQSEGTYTTEDIPF